MKATQLLTRLKQVEKRLDFLVGDAVVSLTQGGTDE